MTISNDKDNENEVGLTTTAEKEASQSYISANTRKGNGEKNFPDPFYCPITKKVMDDPVVLSDGVSYEKSAVTSREENMYPNHALKAVIDDAVAASGTSARAAVVRIQHSMRKVFNNALWIGDRPLSNVYYGRLTFSLIHEPVIDPEGHTFEKVAIVGWIRENGSSPYTSRTELSIGDLFPNHAITELLNIEKNRDESSIHPSIRKFKAEEPPKPNGDVDPEMGGVVGEVEGDFPTNKEEYWKTPEIRRKVCIAKTFLWSFLIYMLLSLSLMVFGYFVPFVLMPLCFVFLCLVLPTFLLG